MSRSSGRTRPVSQAQAQQFAAKAEEFLAAAEYAAVEGHNNAAAGNAVHAGISACDAILGTRTGLRSAGQDHSEVISLIAALPDIGQEAAATLRRLIPLKTKAEYDPAPVSSTDAARAVQQATRLVSLARDVLST
jgi:HEPN domain-containing protein